MPAHSPKPENPKGPDHVSSPAPDPAAQPNPGDPGPPFFEPRTPKDPEADPRLPHEHPAPRGI